MDVSIDNSVNQSTFVDSPNNSPQVQSKQQSRKDPLSNTGGNPGVLAFGLGWLTCTFKTPADTSPEAYSAWVSRLYESQTKDFFLKASYGFNSYQHSRRYRSGAFLAWSEDRLDMCLCLPQKALDRLTDKTCAKLIYRLNALPGFKVTRLDVYYDDLQKIVTPSIVEKALQYGLFPSKSIQYEVIRKFAKENLEGETVYIGSPHSDFYVRIYDKTLESQGKVDATRIEFQMRGEVATAYLLNLIYTTYLDWPERALELLLNKFDFVHRTGPRNDRTTRRLEWWARLVGAKKKVSWRVASVQAKLFDTISWAEQVLPSTFQMLATVLGVEGVATWAANLMRSGAGKLRARHLGMIDDYYASIALAGAA